MVKRSNRLLRTLSVRLRLNYGKKFSAPFPALFIACILGWVAAPSVVAQMGLAHVHPNLARGTGNGKTVENYGFDSINLFNGNLNLAIPLGINYPINPNFSYSFNLAYNSNVWDIDQPASVVTANPIKNSNAGLGWDISFGRLIPPYVNGAQVGKWVYVSPDGTAHPFYSTLHYDVTESDPSDNAMYTRDGSYLRMVALSSTQRFVESPDGRQSLFQLVNNEWRLTQIGDHFNNRLWFTYSTPNAWILTDSQGRTQTIYFKADPAGYYPAIVDRIVLAAFNGSTATYTFTYATANVSRPSADTDPATAASVNLPVLTGVMAPDGSQYQFAYISTAADSSGRLTSMQLPTMGKIDWTYQDYNFVSGTNPTTLAPMFRKTTGVATRKMTNLSGGVDGVWTYTPSLKPTGTEERELSNTVTNPIGDKTVYYFSVNTMATGPEWNKADYGLPFTKNDFDRPRTPTNNVALAANGATASASNTVNAAYPAAAAINGDRKGLNYGNGGVWMDGSVNYFPDWLEVDFSGSKTIDRINVFTVQDTPNSPAEPTSDMTFTQNGIKDFDVQYWNGAAWVTVSGGSVTNNNLVWRAFSFSPLTTNKIRVVVNRANINSQITEVEAFESVLPSDARFLSKQVFDCDSAGGNCQLVRSTYVRYEQDQPLDPASPDIACVNRREASNRVLYYDDVDNGVARFADLNRSNFDGLGHYRLVASDGNFGSADVRTVQVNYDAASGNYPSAGYAMPSPANAWILNTTSLQKIIEGASAQMIEFCYDHNTGFLKRERRWSSANPSGIANSNDVVTVFTPDVSGQIVKEQYYGGDVQAIGTTALCGLALPGADQYQIQHTYQYGVRNSSQFYSDSTTPVGPKFLDQTVDRNSGLVAASRDGAGITTNYEYDAMGRQTWIKPEAGQGAWRQFSYTAATAADYAKKFIYDKTNGGATVLTYNADVYDSFGRLWWEQTAVPGSYPNRYTVYNALGWVTQKSEYSTDAPKYTQYLNFDPFGRARTVRPPEGAQHDVTYQYAGVRNVTRTASVGIWYDATSGQVTEAPKSKTQVFDRQGRLWKTIAQTINGSTESTMVNSYDAAGRLIQTIDGNGNPIGNQQYYDGRGFMYWMHNASGTDTYYQSFDARGNSTKQRPSLTYLTYTYDRAGRLASVSETADPAKVWKQYTYADSNGTNDWRAGKLATAKRYNYTEGFNGTAGTGAAAVVTETYTYGGIGGRMSGYDVSLSDSLGLREEFSQGYAYTELGNVQQINYPNSLVSGSGNMGRIRSVTNNYVVGWLASVTGTLNSQSEPWANSISYFPNGVINQIIHANGVTDNFTNDPNGYVRIASAYTTGVQHLTGQADQNFNSGTFQYDGNQNLVREGAQYFIPQGGQTPPGGSATPSNYVPSCQSGWVDVFGMPFAMEPSLDGSCYPMMLAYYTAGDQLYKLEDRFGDLRTWYFYDNSGRKLTDYNVTNSRGMWKSTRDYVYRDSSILAFEDILNGAANPNTYHFHVGYGGAGIQTDRNGYKTTLPTN